MTPTEILTAARRKYNAVGDSFYADEELLDLLYEACQELAVEAKVIEQTYTTDSVADQQEYAYPTRAIQIKRVTYDGRKLHPINFREDDALTLNNSDSDDTGIPLYYAIWNETLILRPIPAEDNIEIKVYAYAEPAEIDTSSTLEVPTRYHMDCVNFIVSELCAKDENATMAKYYRDRWDRAVSKAKRFGQKMRRGDSFASVIDEESMPGTLLGGA